MCAHAMDDRAVVSYCAIARAMCAGRSIARPTGGDEKPDPRDEIGFFHRGARRARSTPSASTVVDGAAVREGSADDRARARARRRRLRSVTRARWRPALEAAAAVGLDARDACDGVRARARVIARERRRWWTRDGATGCVQEMRARCVERGVVRARCERFGVDDDVEGGKTSER